MLQSPCYDPKTKQHCTKRYPGCSADCPDWDDYVEIREEMYRKRRHASRIYVGGDKFELDKKNHNASSRKRNARLFRGLRKIDD